jgi:hypothetical protein
MGRVHRKPVTGCRDLRCTVLLGAPVRMSARRRMPDIDAVSVSVTPADAPARDGPAADRALRRLI